MTQYEVQEQNTTEDTIEMTLDQAKDLLLGKDRLIAELTSRIEQNEQDQASQFVRVKAKINRIVEQNYQQLKQTRKSYLELELKYTEANQLLSLLIPKDVRKSQPDMARQHKTFSSSKKKPKLAITEDFARATAADACDEIMVESFKM